MGEDENGKFMGKCGLGRMNERGNKLVEFCYEKFLIINEWFKNHKRRKYEKINALLLRG